ncbi:DUF2169 domain-containing protein [Myxococcus stipitatus]|uniref:DUF2169 family type VI secretion system accessory protein n=1 Tax=Myxococcus stipitatus TaxID=83455 RepID=UPI0031456E1E
MWRLVNRTPYAAERTWLRDHSGHHVWVVAVKATYVVRGDGRVCLADEQIPPLLAPEYRGDPGRSSLVYEVDLADAKPGTDIILNASAYAPGNKPQGEVRVGLRIGDLQKILVVRGDRIWEPNLLKGVSPSAPKPFSSLPIIYERAWGGLDTSSSNPRMHRMEGRNPVGCGFATSSALLVGRPVPNVAYPGDDALSHPAGFGAIASHWSPRRECWGTFDEAWARKRKPLLPLDYSPQALMCSPADQRPTGYLRGGERVRMVHMTPAGLLDFELPKVDLRFQTRFGSRRIEHDARLYTVVIEPDEARLLMTWHTALPCHQDAEALDETLISEAKRAHAS